MALTGSPLFNGSWEREDAERKKKIEAEHGTVAERIRKAAALIESLVSSGSEAGDALLRAKRAQFNIVAKKAELCDQPHPAEMNLNAPFIGGLVQTRMLSIYWGLRNQKKYSDEAINIFKHWVDLVFEEFQDHEESGDEYWGTHERPLPIIDSEDEFCEDDKFD